MRRLRCPSDPRLGCFGHLAGLLPVAEYSSVFRRRESECEEIGEDVRAVMRFLMEMDAKLSKIKALLEGDDGEGTETDP